MFRNVLPNFPKKTPEMGPSLILLGGGGIVVIAELTSSSFQVAGRRGHRDQRRQTEFREVVTQGASGVASCHMHIRYPDIIRQYYLLPDSAAPTERVGDDNISSPSGEGSKACLSENSGGSVAI